MRSFTSCALAAPGATYQPISRRGKPYAITCVACASKASGFDCSQPYGKPNVSGLGGTDSRAQQSWMRRASRLLRSQPGSAGLMRTSMSRGASAISSWIRLGCCFRSMSPLPISTIPEVPDVCLLGCHWRVLEAVGSVFLEGRSSSPARRRCLLAPGTRGGAAAW
jgi:hypothetical protein